MRKVKIIYIEEILLVLLVFFSNAVSAFVEIDGKAGRMHVFFDERDYDSSRVKPYVFSILDTSTNTTAINLSGVEFLDGTSCQSEECFPYSREAAHENQKGLGVSSVWSFDKPFKKIEVDVFTATGVSGGSQVQVSRITHVEDGVPCDSDNDDLAQTVFSQGFPKIRKLERGVLIMLHLDDFALHSICLY